MNAVRDHAALLSPATGGRLEFVGGAANVALRANPETEDLYRARFEGAAPKVVVEGGTVIFRYLWGLLDWRKRGADVMLNARIPWRIAVGGGLYKLDADLSGLQLDSFEVEGGAYRVELTLPKPSGTVPIRIGGGVSNVTVRRPNGVAACVLVGGRASKLALDDQYFGAVGGEAGEPEPRRRHGSVRDHHHRRRQQRDDSRFVSAPCPAAAPPAAT